ncbi:unnamed protein product [Spirodela intermedia]|uniref:Uncharacterized protein n=2 Tax=Spirodela intermedia TaxID=51605 RepID=A0A7I8IA54_SPIIN|nr:unnamed protein product [Spirodela intermedia]CAA6654470.1 unnamed protein product [Spirodela intermedia]CAA7389069.1 unnamed protein product [Spirodela intermedia]
MGATGSRTEDSNALIVCRERKNFVRQALDERIALAEAHVSYIQSLKNTGIAIRKLVEAEPFVESSLGTSTSATPEPLALTDKSTSQFSSSSPSLSQHAEGVDSISPSSSSTYSGRFQAFNMKSSGGFSKTVEERPPLALTGRVRSSSDDSPKEEAPNSDEFSIFEDPSAPITETRGWDYFGIFHSIDDQFSFHDGNELNNGTKSPNDIRRLREEEGIPELEEEKHSSRGRSEGVDSEDEFEKTTSEPLVRIFRNRSQVIDSHLTNGSFSPDVENPPQASEQKIGEKTACRDGIREAHAVPDPTPGRAAPTPVTPLTSGKKEGKRENSSENKAEMKDLFMSVKEIELLFVRASEAGIEVPRMLEANKVNFSPLSPDGAASRSKASTLLAALFICCRKEIHITQDPVTTEMKHLTWHRSVSSLSSSSRSPIVAAVKSVVEPSSNTLLSSTCMNSGSHASTLDRLYAWESKLYDEVKANGVLCRKYDIKCRLLRDQDLKDEKPYRVDKTRAHVKDLHSSICIAIHRIDSISRKIEEIRDKELQPQLEELIGGLTRMWGTMLECHKLQYEIIREASNTANPKVTPRSEYLRLAAAALQSELNGLNSSFNKWIAAHRDYLRALNNWLLKCLKRVEQVGRRKNNVFPPPRAVGPPIYVACREWLAELEKLPDKATSDSIRRLAMETSRVLPREEKKKKNSNNHQEVIGREETIDWGSCLETLQRCLVDLLGHLKGFSGESQEMYKRLGSAIDEARRRYEAQKAADQRPSDCSI